MGATALEKKKKERKSVLWPRFICVFIDIWKQALPMTGALETEK